MTKVVPSFDLLLCWTEDVWADSLSLVLSTWYQFGSLFDLLTWFPVRWVRSVWLVLFCWGNERWSRAGWNRMCSSDTGTSQKGAKDFNDSSFWLYWGYIKWYGLHHSCCQISLYWELRQKWEKSLKYFTHIGSSHKNNWHACAWTLIKSSWRNCSTQCLQRKGESPLTLLSTQTMVYSTKDQNPNQNEHDKSGGQTNTVWRASNGEQKAEIQVSNRCHFNHTTSWVQPSAFQWPSQHLAWQHSETIPGDLLKNSLRNYPSLVFYKIKSFWGVETSTSSQVKGALVRCVWHKLDVTPDLCHVSANFSKCWKGH